MEIVIHWVLDTACALVIAVLVLLLALDGIAWLHTRSAPTRAPTAPRDAPPAVRLVRTPYDWREATAACDVLGVKGEAGHE